MLVSYKDIKGAGRELELTFGTQKSAEKERYEIIFCIFSLQSENTATEGNLFSGW